MATVDDVEVANASFPNVRQDLNDILEALATNFSADAEPTTTYPNQFWYETDTNLLYIRNEADDAWITLASINQTSGEWEPRTAVIQAVDSAGLALKTDEGTTRFSISDAGVVSFENYSFPSADGTDGQVLTTDGAGNLTFESGAGGDKIEEGNSSVEVVDTGTGHVAVTVDGSETARFDANGRLGIGTTSPSSRLSLFASSANGLHLGQQTDNTSNSARLFFDNSTNIWTAYSTIGDFKIASGATIGSSSGTTQFELTSGGNLQFNSGYGSVATAYGCRAWVNFNGQGTVAIRDSGNVSSITDNGTGIYTVNFTTAMPDDDYCTTFGGHRISGATNYAALISQTGTPSSSSIRITTATDVANSPSDFFQVMVSVFR